MKGDFTRFTHDPKKHFTGVLKQQGRVDLDSDWNEQVEIDEHLRQRSQRDIIGRCGAPLECGGLKIDVLSVDLFGIYFTDKEHAWAVGSRGAILVMEKMKWSRQCPPVGVTRDLRGVFFLEITGEHQGWAVGDRGTIITTVDGGKRWVKCESGTVADLHGVFFLEKNLGWVVGSGGTILKWDGESWSLQNSAVSSDLYAVHFINRDNGYAVGAKGTILHWDGLVWSSQISDTTNTNDLLAVGFINENNGYAVGAIGTILFWNGQNWSVQNINNYDIRSVHFRDTNAYVVGDEGKLYNLINGEVKSYKNLYNGKLNAIYFRDGLGCSVGASGAIFIGQDDGKWTMESLGDLLCSSIIISQGSINVDGVLAEMDHEATFWNQPDSPHPQSLEAYRCEEGKPRTDLVYLDVWQRIITSADDHEIKEVALGGPDTSARIKTVCQVRVIPDVKDEDCSSALDQGSGIGLTSKVDLALSTKDPCKIMPSGGYSGLENRLYRVEIHDGGEPPTWPRPEGIKSALVVPIFSQVGGIESSQIELKADEWELDDLEWQMGQAIEVFSNRTDKEGRIGKIARIAGIDGERRRLTLDVSLREMAGDEGLRARRVATFKWSRDNGSVVLLVENFLSSKKIKLGHLGRDQRLTVHNGDWIEVLDDAAELLMRPGTMAQIEEEIDEDKREVALSKDLGLLDKKGHPKVRRWDQKSDVIPVAFQGFIDLEEGIQIRFSKRDGSTTTRLKNGDYWVFAARTITGSIEVLESAPPRGIKHHYCNIALIKWERKANSLTVTVKDCRRAFPTLTDLVAMHYVGGDGQSGMPPEYILDNPLRVGVSNGGIPVKGISVNFLVKAATGVPKGKVKRDEDPKWSEFVDVITGDDGVAECRWQLDQDVQGQVVEATLLYPGKHIPIQFTASPRPTGLSKVVKITDIYAADTKNNLTPLGNGERARLDLLYNGLRVECDKIVDPKAVEDKPVFNLIIDLPYPTAKDSIGFQPIKLANKLSVDINEDKSIISWEPLPSTKKWLMNYFDVPDVIPDLLANIELKGNFIWAKDEPGTYLDGDSFANPVLPKELIIGDRIGGGDLRMWFWIAPPAIILRLELIKEPIICGVLSYTSGVMGRVSLHPKPKNNAAIKLFSEMYEGSFPESPEKRVYIVADLGSVTIDAGTNEKTFSIPFSCYYVPSIVGTEIKITAQYQENQSILEDYVTFRVNKSTLEFIA